MTEFRWYGHCNNIEQQYALAHTTEGGTRNYQCQRTVKKSHLSNSISGGCPVGPVGGGGGGAGPTKTEGLIKLKFRL